MTNYAAAPLTPCPTCGSNAPHLHPAVALEGEVHTCADAYHLIPTNQNRPEYIARVELRRAQEVV